MNIKDRKKYSEPTVKTNGESKQHIPENSKNNPAVNLVPKYSDIYPATTHDKLPIAMILNERTEILNSIPP